MTDDDLVRRGEEIARRLDVGARAKAERHASVTLHSDLFGIDGCGGVSDAPRNGSVFADEIPPPPEPVEDGDQDDRAVGDQDDLLAGMFDGAWLDKQSFPPLEYTVPGIIPEGFGLLVAPPKAGKSWLVCGVGLACASGGTALGRITVAKRPVLYLALEDGDRRLQSRCRKIMCNQPIPAGIHFITRAESSRVIFAMLSEFLHRHGDEKPLVILDTLGRAKPYRPAGADPYQFDYQVGVRLKTAVDEIPGATLLVVHHTRKQVSSDFVDSVSGTQGIAGAADFVLVLARKRHRDEAILSVTGRDVVEAEYALTVNDGLWDLDGMDLMDAAATARRKRDCADLGDRSADAMAFVSSRPLGTRPADLARHLGIDADTAGRYLRRLHETGRIAKRTRGIYIPLSEVSEVSESEDRRGPHKQGEHIETDIPDISDTGIPDEED